MALLWNPAPTPVFDPNTGEPANGAKAYFFAGGTPSTPLAVFTTDDASIPHANPVVASAAGVFPPIFIPYGTYGYRVVTDDGDMITPVVSLVQNPAPAASGGGGTVPDSERFKTGDTKWLFGPGPLDGFVHINAKTIGNAGSGATERANEDTEDLFIWLYDRLDNTICPVSSGRGSTAAADYAAGKTLQLPSMRGKAPFGVDDMGNSAANVLQVSTTITTTNASATATVASAAGLVIGMYAVADTIPAGTTISDLTGTTVTLSTGVGVTAGVAQAVRFSFFTDAQKAGQSAGGASSILLAKQLPANIPNSASSSTTVSAPPGFSILLSQGNNQLYTAGATAAPLSSGGVPSLPAVTATTVAINPTGDQRHGNLPPATLVHWFLKL